MRKLFQVIAFLTVSLLVMPNFVFAHSSLVSSNPADNQTVTEEIKEIVLEFNGNIEPLSTLTVTDEQGTEYPVADIKVENTKMFAALAQSLKTGVYTVNWKIVSGDGHPVEGAFSFTVEIPITEDPTEERSTEEAANNSSDSAGEPPSAPTETSNSAANGRNFLEEHLVHLIIMGIGLVVIVAGVGFFSKRLKNEEEPLENEDEW